MLVRCHPDSLRGDVEVKVLYELDAVRIFIKMLQLDLPLLRFLHVFRQTFAGREIIDLHSI